jgi:hypothetical protein
MPGASPLSKVKQAARNQGRIQVLTLTAREQPFIDVTAVGVLDQLTRELAARGVLYCARDIGQVRELEASRRWQGKLPRMPHRLDHGASGAIRRFAGWVARGPVGHPMLDGVKYWDELKDSPSQMCFAVFANVRELDGQGNPVSEVFRTPRCDVALPVLHWRIVGRRTGP